MLFGRRPAFYGTSPIPWCGCYIFVQQEQPPKYLPLTKIDAHATILSSSSSRTTLTQTFVNPSSTSVLEDVRYRFPLYDGVSVVDFTCTVGSRVIRGVVRERQKAKQEYKAAVDRGETAALFEQSLNAADVFTTSLGNIPADETINIRITYLGELKHDAEVDGLRFTIPTNIAPRYGEEHLYSPATRKRPMFVTNDATAESMSITVDVDLADARSTISSVQSPSHPISVSIGTTTASAAEPPSLQRASATLALGSTHLEKDFIVRVVATNLGNPTAVLETHPTIPNQRAVMASLVPKFNIPADRPEVVFVCDRSGSMSGSSMVNLIAALQIFLKSLPLGVKFNICSFGSRHDFLWPKSRSYDQDSLEQAVNHVAGISANYGGTVIYAPIEDTFKRRYSDMNLEVFLLTDGEIHDQDDLFRLVNDEVAEAKGAIRVFTLGIGRNASHALVEGVARAGNGFAQTVADDEKMDKKLIRMLKGALTPHITDYSLEIKYSGKNETGDADGGDDDGFEMVEKVMDAMSLTPDEGEAASYQGSGAAPPKQPISLFDSEFDADGDASMHNASASIDSKYDHLPALPAPRYLQAPSRVPHLYPFSRTTVYVLLSDSTPQRLPKSVILKGTSAHGPLELEIPITSLATKGTTVHQLAARRAIKELEEGRGWLADAKDADGKLLKDRYEGRFSDMVEREAVRIGLEYQVAGKWTSFVAVDANDDGKTPTETEASRAEYQQDVDAFRGMAKRRKSPGSAPMHGVMPMYKMMSMGQATRSRGSPSGDDLQPQSFSFGGSSSSSEVFSTSSKSSALFGSATSGNVSPHASARLSGPPSRGRGGSASGSLFGHGGSSGGLFGTAPAAASLSALAPGVSSGGLFGMAPAAAPLSAAPAPGVSSGGLFGMASAAAPLSAPAPSGVARRQLASKAERKSGPVKPGEEAGSLDGVGSDPANPLSALAALQTFVGSWSWNPDLERVIGVTREQASRLRLPAEYDNQADILATICAVAYMKKKLADDMDTWEMLVDKAEAWLVQQTGATMDALETAAEGLF